jgi:hypothetical protein
LLGEGAGTPGARNWLHGRSSIGGPAGPSGISWSNSPIHQRYAALQTETCAVHPAPVCRRRCASLVEGGQEQQTASGGRQCADSPPTLLISAMVRSCASILERGRMISLPLTAATSTHETAWKTRLGIDQPAGPPPLIVATAETGGIRKPPRPSAWAYHCWGSAAMLFYQSCRGHVHDRRDYLDPHYRPPALFLYPSITG